MEYISEAHHDKEAPMAPKYSVGQLLALDKPGLVQHIANNQTEAGMFDASNITDWNKVPEAQLIELVERLQDAGPGRMSDPVDFDQVVARLNDVTQKTQALQEHASSSPRPTRELTESPEPTISKEHEIRCYHELVGDGGRPPYPLETLDMMYVNPAAYVEMLRPWMERSAQDLDSFGVFSRPLERWKEFRRRQLDNRGTDTTDEESLAAFRDEKRRYFESVGLIHSTIEPDYDETIQRMWLSEQPRRQLEKDSSKKAYGGSLATFAEAARRRLRGHGFDEAFQLLEDPKQQSKRVYQDVQLCQKRHDAARMELIQSGILKDGETPEDLDLFSLEAPNWNKNEPSQVARNRAIAQYIRQQKLYQYAKVDEAHQRAIVQWALDEITAIHHETSSVKPARNTKKRRLQSDDEAAEGPVEQPTTKKQKQQQEGAARRPAERKTKPRNRRIILGLECPVTESWTLDKDGGLWIGPVGFVFADSHWLSRNISQAPIKGVHMYVPIKYWCCGGSKQKFWTRRVWKAACKTGNSTAGQVSDEFARTKKYFRDYIGIDVDLLLHQSRSEQAPRLDRGELGFLGPYLAAREFRIATASESGRARSSEVAARRGEFRFDGEVGAVDELVAVVAANTITKPPNTQSILLGLVTRGGISRRVELGYIYYSKDTRPVKPQ
ncbi:hypothetical protein F5X99DRAFT_415054 [Biscogniauxia marginata]|nr:hypothetical protein F5X99DRAFT_415054 [Biscogniauxia marginata]